VSQDALGLSRVTHFSATWNLALGFLGAASQLFYKGQGQESTKNKMLGTVHLLCGWVLREALQR